VSSKRKGSLIFGGIEKWRWKKACCIDAWIANYGNQNHALKNRRVARILIGIAQVVAKQLFVIQALLIYLQKQVDIMEEEDDPMINFWKAWVEANELEKADLCVPIANNFLIPKLNAENPEDIELWKRHIASLLNSYFMDLESFIAWKSVCPNHENRPKIFCSKCVDNMRSSDVRKV
jgi:hypothetical protein